jgi:hypothetical protein
MRSEGDFAMPGIPAAVERSAMAMLALTSGKTWQKGNWHLAQEVRDDDPRAAAGPRTRSAYSRSGPPPLNGSRGHFMAGGGAA